MFVEGPYGILTGARRTRRRVTLIAGGIGITPLRALLEALPGDPGDLTLIYRASHPRNVVFGDELETLARAPRGPRPLPVRLARARRPGLEPPSPPLDAVDAGAGSCPDIADQDVYLCGPTGFMRTVEAVLDELGVPRRHVHAERFAY